MANIKISQLTNATTPLTGTEQVPIVQGGITVKTTISDIGTKTNPTADFIPLSDGASFVDSNLLNSIDTLLRTYTNSIGGYGLSVDFGNFVTKLGDFEGFNGGLYIDNTQSNIKTKFGPTANVGLKLDFLNNIYALGDYELGYHNGVSFIVDDNLHKIYTTAISNVANGLLLDFDNNEYKFGDYDNGINYLEINVAFGISTLYGNIKAVLSSDSGNQTLEVASNNTIVTSSNGYNTGLRLDFANNSYIFGSFNGFNNDTAIYVDDAIQRIRFTSNIGGYNFYAMTTYASNAAALIAGLQVGDVYKFADGSLHIVY